MKIVHHVPSLDREIGGPARSVPALCAALAADGHDVSLVAYASKNFPETPKGVRFIPLKSLAGSRQFPGAGSATRLLDVFKEADLVHLHSLWNPATHLAGYLARRAGVPYVISPRGMLQDVALTRRPGRKRIAYIVGGRKLLRRAAGFHFLTVAELESSSKRLPRSAVRFVVPTGIDTTAVRAERGRFRERRADLAGKPMIVFLGRLHWSKGLDLQVEAARLLKDKVAEFSWVFIGPDDGERASLERQAAAIGIRENVRFTGSLDAPETWEALADADVFVLSSRHEAQSVALNEALAIGVPIVVTRSVSLEEVGNYGAGRVVENDAGSLAVAIEEVITGPAAADEMRAAARRMCSELYSWDVIAGRMCRCYREVLTAGPAID